MTAATNALRGAATVAAVAIGGYVGGQQLAHRSKPADSEPPPPSAADKLVPVKPVAAPPLLPAAPAARPADPKMSFWYDRWSSGQLGWHLEKPHPVLQAHLNEWLGDNGETQRTVLFPLCGASVDLGCIARRGHQVVGVEGVSAGIDRLLGEYGDEIKGGTPPDDGTLWMRVGQPNWMQRIVAEQLGKAEGRAYQPAPFLFAVQGDFLKFDREAAGKWGFSGFDCAFDRGGLVAVPPSDRERYADVLADQMVPGGKLLLVTVEHEPAFGPPHAVDEAEVRRLLSTGFEIQKLSKTDLLDAEPHWRKRGATSFHEVAYMCTRRK